MVIVAIESHLGALYMQISTIGLDIAKNVFQVHGIDAAEKVVVRKRLPAGVLQSVAAVPDRHGSMCHSALLGARADEARPRGAPNAGEGCEGLRQAQQKRCG